MNDPSDSSMFQQLFDSMPSIAFVVDDDVRIKAFNHAAAGVLLEGGERAMDLQAGEAFGCAHAAESGAKCGLGPLCHRCVIRNSVGDSFRGVRASRRRTHLELLSDGERMEMYALVTASPFNFRSETLSLLVIEDISIITELTRIIPICAGCGKVRDGGDAWIRVEAYFSHQWGVDFSHGMCPDCLDEQMKKLEMG